MLAVAERTAVLPTGCRQITERLTEQEAAFGNFASGVAAGMIDRVGLVVGSYARLAGKARPTTDEAWWEQ